MNRNAFPFRLPDYSAFLQGLAREVGGVILAHRADATEDTKRKLDGSPVTAADLAAQKIIIAGLTALTPDIPIIAEEKANPATLAATGTYWLVDPLDGTQDFVQGGNEFSVNIGLVQDSAPILGVIYAPAPDDMFFGEPGNALRVKNGVALPLSRPLAIKPSPMVNLITSRREARKLPVAAWVRDGLVADWRVCSSAYKFGLLAAGEADLFLRTGTTYEWDTAAGDAILRAVGGHIMVGPEQPLAYAKPDFRNGDFVAYTAAYDSKDLPEFFTRFRQPGV